MASKPFLPYEMELFRTDSYYVLLNSTSSLWCNRKTGAIEVKPGWELANAGDPECMGVFYGVVGRLDFDGGCGSGAGAAARLVLIKSTAPVGQLPSPAAGTVHKICAVAVLHIQGAADELNLRPCKKHRRSTGADLLMTSQLRDGGGHSGGGSGGGGQLAKTWGSIKSATSTIKNTTQHAAALATSQVKGGSGSAAAKSSTTERRILDEVQRIFADTDSFYFSVVSAAGQPGDLTNSMQRHCEGAQKRGGAGPLPVWHTVDERFFWNKHMLRDIIQLNNPLADCWILPIIQGFVQIETCQLEVGFDPIDISIYSPKYETLTISLVSRRSRHRAGTRYKRRGVDEAGKCANYVETEQIVGHGPHQVAFTQVRGSVPVYWSQPGYKYRPPPRLDKGEAETRLAFEKHFEEEVGCYGAVCIVNLVEQSGKERVIWDAYTQHVLAYNSPQLVYATFDFHEYCRGMHFENVSVLVGQLADVLHEFGFCWMDRQGIICRQNGVFRVNCIDCLDRTNVVQTALAKAMLQMQLTKLGLLPPEGSLPQSLRRCFQLLWANNGDIISKQYAGTNALKGDYTRTGERKLSGMMKDGMNSANRYYLSRFKDVYRQATIDIMQGAALSEDLASFSADRQEQEEEDRAATAEHVKLLLEDCKKMLIQDSAMVLGAWGLIDADPQTGDPTETDMDSILILTRDSYYVADYDEDIDQITKYNRVMLVDVESVELGPMQMSAASQSLSMNIFNKARGKSADLQHCLRINYSVDGASGYCHTFRSTNLRFFNNVAVVIHNDDEMIESLRAICETMEVALQVAGVADAVAVVVVATGGAERLERRVSRQRSPAPPITRNVSETQLHSLKNVGSKALSNVTQQFNKLNKLGHSFNTRRRHSKTSTESTLKPIGVGGGDSLKQQLEVEGEVETAMIASEWQEQDGGLKEGSHLAEQHTSAPVERRSSEYFSPVSGIIMSSTDIAGNLPHHLQSPHHHRQVTDNIRNESLERVIEGGSRKYPLLHAKTDLTIDVTRLASVTSSSDPNSSGGHTPEIVINRVARQESEETSHHFNATTRQYSHSSGEVDSAEQVTTKKSSDKVGGDKVGGGMERSTSEKDLILSGITSSQSETAIKSMMRSTATMVQSSPSSTLSPFSKIARGVQSLGANLDPRKLKGGGGAGGRGGGGASGAAVVTSSQQDARAAEVERLQRVWKSGKCRTRLIAV